MASNNRPIDKAHRKIEERAHELQLRAAVAWCNAEPSRKAADAVKLQRFSLLLGEKPERAVKNLGQAIRDRRPHGSRIKRSDRELLTDDEYDELMARYLDAGYRGGFNQQAVQLLKQGLVDLLRARADDVVCTPCELEKLKPGATSVADSWCNVIVELVKMLKVSCCCC